MRTSTIAAGAALLASASAIPTPWGHGGLWGPDPAKCLTATSANYLATGFQSLIVAYTTAEAETLLAADFTDYSNSILSLQGLPLGGPAFPSKAAFEAGQGAQPSVPFNILAIDAFNCQNVTMRWNANFGGPNKTVNGMTHLSASNTQGLYDTWQIETVYTEFDSIAWLKAIGGSVTPPSH